MRTVNSIVGAAYPLGRNNVDTDIILPGRFLKTISREGLGGAAFEAIRAEPGNVFADRAYAGSPILVAGQNFGCGSSREHAVWAMLDMGIEAVIASSFSDIFAGNAFKNGLLTVVLAEEALGVVMDCARVGEIGIDLSTQKVTLFTGEAFSFAIDPFRRHCLLNGLDEIGLSLGFEAEITAFERIQDNDRPWIARPFG